MEINNKGGYQALVRPIPHLNLSFQVQEYADCDCHGEGIWGLFEEIEIVIEDEVELDGTRDIVPEEQLPNSTSTPILIPQISW